MLRYMFSAFFFLLLLMFCVPSVATNAEQKNNSELDELKNKSAVNKDVSNVKVLNIPKLRKASFVGVDGTVVALIQATDSNGKHEIFIKYIGTQEGNWEKEIKEGTNWKLPTEFKWDDEEKVALAMVAKDNKIYIFAASKPQPSSSASAPDKKWNVKFAVGTIKSGGGQASKMEIKWTNQQTPVSLNVDRFENELTDVSPVDGSAFLTEDGALVFVVRAVRNNNNDKKNVFVVAHSKNTETDFEVSFVEGKATCHSSFFSWGKKLFMVPEFCNETDKKLSKVQESNDMGRTWTDADGPLAEKLNELTGGKAFFTTTTVDNKRVLLFTEDKMGTNVTPENDKVNLFMSNDKCIKELGPIMSNVFYVPYGSFLHTNNELFFLSQVLYKGNYNIVGLRLTEQLKNIKSTLGQQQCEEEKEMSGGSQQTPLSPAGFEEKEATSDAFLEDRLNAAASGKDAEQKRESGDGSVHLRATVAVVSLLFCVLLSL